ncbi:hypothetical protein [Kitasatospora sp. NPDC087314]|uniref:hypothetical protein n=1 Tax=Kitasatospora sp. NPDC087314 TaxID=3364068 RepID=UPI0037F1B11E
MEIAEILDRIARDHHGNGYGWWPYLGGLGVFHRVSDIVVNGSLGWAQPAPGELVPIYVPPGRYPVYLELVANADPKKRGEYGLPASWVSLAVVPLAAPQVIAEALAAGRLDNPIEDYQPLGPVGAIWSDDGPMPIGWDRAFAARADAQLAAGAEAGRVPNVVEVPAESGDGAKCIAFHVETAAGCGSAAAVRDPAGNLVCLILGNSG